MNTLSSKSLPPNHWIANDRLNPRAPLSVSPWPRAWHKHCLGRLICGSDSKFPVVQASEVAVLVVRQWCEYRDAPMGLKPTSDFYSNMIYIYIYINPEPVADAWNWCEYLSESFFRSSPQSGLNSTSFWIGLVGKIWTGNHRFSHEIWGLNQ